MNEPNNFSAWVERAEEDFAMAGSALRRKKPLLYPACFHAQQCAEKYLKAILIAKQLPFPKTHDLLMLSALCNEAGFFIPIQDQELNTLNDYSVQVRYPGENPTVEDAKEAMRIAKKVRSFVRKFLGVKYNTSSYPFSWKDSLTWLPCRWSREGGLMPGWHGRAGVVGWCCPRIVRMVYLG